MRRAKDVEPGIGVEPLEVSRRPVENLELQKHEASCQDALRTPQGVMRRLRRDGQHGRRLAYGRRMRPKGIHVALHARVTGPMRSRMSLCRGVNVRTSCQSCRLGRRARATCRAPHVARYERAERHGRRGMSHCTRAWGDIFGRRCRLSRARRATCKGWDVAPHADPERHACPGMSLRTRAKCDIDRIEVSLEPSIKATFTLLLGVPRACEVRHAAATSGARTRECTADQVETLAHALQSVRPDLAEQVLDLGRKTAIAAGVLRSVVRRGAPSVSLAARATRPRKPAPTRATRVATR